MTRTLSRQIDKRLTRNPSPRDEVESGRLPQVRAAIAKGQHAHLQLIVGACLMYDCDVR